MCDDVSGVIFKNMKITEKRIKEIIAEEIKAKSKVTETVDHAASATVVTHASKLLKALETFDEHATDQMKNSVIPNFDAIKQTLENMVSTPGSYVKTPSTRKVVSLRKVDNVQ